MSSTFQSYDILAAIIDLVHCLYVAEHASCIHTFIIAFIIIVKDLTRLLAGQMLPEQSTDLATRRWFLGDLIILFFLYIHQFS